VREGATAFLKAAALRDKQRDAVEKLDDCAQVLRTISGFLGVGKLAITGYRRAMELSGSNSIQEFLSMLNILPDVHVLVYKSEKCNARAVVMHLQDTPVWQQFIKLASESDTQQVTLIVILKGLVSFVITNKAVKPPAGVLFHKIISNSEKFNDVTLFALDQIHLFMSPEQIHTN